MLQWILDAVRVVRHGEGARPGLCDRGGVCSCGSRFRVDGLGCSVTSVSGSAVRD